MKEKQCRFCKKVPELRLIFIYDYLLSQARVQFELSCECNQFNIRPNEGIRDAEFFTTPRLEDEKGIVFKKPLRCLELLREQLEKLHAAYENIESLTKP